MQHAKQLDYMEILKLDDDELQKRLAFFELTDEDFERLAGLKSFADRWTHEITEGLYEFIMGQPESRGVLPGSGDPESRQEDAEHIFHRPVLRQHTTSTMFATACGWAAHERIGMPPKLYPGRIPAISGAHSSTVARSFQR